MISFEISEEIRKQREYAEKLSREQIRPFARYYDENEHEVPWDFAKFIWDEARYHIGCLLPGSMDLEEPFMSQMHSVEALSWGDQGFYLCIPWPALGGTAVLATGTEEQKERFLKRFHGKEITWASMALTEAHCGSDSAAIRTRAVRDGDSWVLNGEKLFVSTAKASMIDSKGIMIVWATIDPSLGRKGMRLFVVESGTPGLKITRLEKKLGMRASDTAVVVLEDCRVPLENMLSNVGDPNKAKSFKGAMATFDSARPTAAASGAGIARATLDFLKEQLAQNGIVIRYDKHRYQMSAIEKDIVDMEAQLEAAWLLILKAAWLIDQKKPNTVESSMSKLKAGEIVTKITQKGIELMGNLGYSRKLLLEKWMRDGKVIDLFEGTGQINRLIVARRILGYKSKDLK
ncbi:MAG: acyl-CoA dehydrogenase family protein [Acidobacteriota bacterium]|jgi:acyl-CoA dehydrogenase